MDKQTVSYIALALIEGGGALDHASHQECIQLMSYNFCISVYEA